MALVETDGLSTVKRGVSNRGGRTNSRDPEAKGGVERLLGQLAFIIGVGLVADLAYSEATSHGSWVPVAIALGVLIVAGLGLRHVWVDTELQVTPTDVRLVSRAPRRPPKIAHSVARSEISGWYVRSIKGASSLSILTLHAADGRRLLKYNCQPWAGNAEEIRRAFTRFEYPELQTRAPKEQWTRMSDLSKIRADARQRRIRRITGGDPDKGQDRR